MAPAQHLRRALSFLAALGCLGLLTVSPSAQAQVVGESPEIVYSGTDAQLLRDKAAQLGTAVAIYEYLHNTIEHSPYHGSRSGSVNTFLGRRGSDVDIASTLIADAPASAPPANTCLSSEPVISIAPSQRRGP